MDEKERNYLKDALNLAHTFTDPEVQEDFRNITNSGKLYFHKSKPLMFYVMVLAKHSPSFWAQYQKITQALPVETRSFFQKYSYQARGMSQDQRASFIKQQPDIFRDFFEYCYKHNREEYQRLQNISSAPTFSERRFSDAELRRLAEIEKMPPDQQNVMLNKLLHQIGQATNASYGGAAAPKEDTDRQAADDYQALLNGGEIADKERFKKAMEWGEKNQENQKRSKQPSSPQPPTPTPIPVTPPPLRPSTPSPIPPTPSSLPTTNYQLPTRLPRLPMPSFIKNIASQGQILARKAIAKYGTNLAGSFIGATLGGFGSGPIGIVIGGGGGWFLPGFLQSRFGNSVGRAVTGRMTAKAGGAALAKGAGGLAARLGTKAAAAGGLPGIAIMILLDPKLGKVIFYTIVGIILFLLLMPIFLMLSKSSSLLPPYEMPIGPPIPVAGGDITSCTFSRGTQSAKIKSSILGAWISQAAAKAGVPPAVMASVDIHENPDFFSNADNNHDGIKNNYYYRINSSGDTRAIGLGQISTGRTPTDQGMVDHCYSLFDNGIIQKAAGYAGKQLKGDKNYYCVSDVDERVKKFCQTNIIKMDTSLYTPPDSLYDKNYLNLCVITDNLAVQAAMLSSKMGSGSWTNESDIKKAAGGYHGGCSFPGGDYCTEVWNDYQNCRVGPKPIGPTIPAQPGCATALYQVPLIDQLAPGNNDACGSSNPATCGPVSAAMVLQSLGINTPAPQLVEEWRASNAWSCDSGFNAPVIPSSINSKYGQFVTAGYHGPKNTTNEIFNIIKNTNNPVLYSTYTGNRIGGAPHMAVIEQICPTQVTIADPDGGKRYTIDRTSLDQVLQSDNRGEVISFRKVAQPSLRQVCTGSEVTFDATKMLLPLPDEKPVCRTTLSGSCGRPGFCVIPTKVVLHITASDASAIATYNFFANGALTSEGLVGSATQFIIGKSGETLQLVNMYTDKVEVAWGTAGYQDHISIEMVNANVYNNASEAPSAQYQKTLTLVKSLMEHYNIPLGNLEFDWIAPSNQAILGLTGVFGHYQLNPQTRSDPGRGFMRDFREDLKRL